MPCKPACPTCETLRAAALDVVGKDGIDALTLAALTARSDLTAPELTRHYPSAAACLRETYVEVSASVREEFLATLAAGSSWTHGLRGAARRLLQRMSENPAEARLCFVEILRADRELQRARDDARRLMLERIVAEHRRRREEEQVPDMQIELLMGAGFHAITAAVIRGGASELPELERELVQLDGVFDLLPA
jgi:AcrR family transcriptional regulator